MYPQSPTPGYPMMPQAPVKGPRQYSIFGAMVRSPFFSGNLYRDVARNWGGIGFWYLFLLELITWTLLLVKFHWAVAAFAKNDFPTMVQDVPPITLRNGHVTSPVNQPYYMKDTKTGKPFAVLDTTGTINTLDDTDPGVMVLITDHKVWSRQDKNQIKETDLSTIKKSFYIDKSKLTGWMDSFSRFAAIGALPVFVIACLIGRLLWVLLCGAVNMAFSAGFGAELTFAAAMRLAVLAITPIILLNTVFELTGASIPLWMLLGICLELLYMAMAVRANARPKAPPPGFPVTVPPGGYAPQGLQR